MIKNLTLLLLVVLFVAGIAEALLQLFDYPHYPAAMRVGWKYMGKDRKNTNQYGYRGQKITYGPSDFVTVLLGDSQVEADCCSFEDMPEKIIEKEMTKTIPKAKVFSIGAGGYGNDQELLALSKYFSQHRANLVLVWLTPSNDIWNNLFPTHVPLDGMPKPTYWLENNELKGWNLPPDSLIYENSPFKLFYILQRLKRYVSNPLAGIDKNWESRTMPRAYKPLQTFNGNSIDLSGNREHYLASEKSNLMVRYAPISPRTKYGVRLTNKLLKEIEHVCAKNGAKVLFFYVNNYTDFGADCIKQNDDFFLISKKSYLQNREQMTQSLPIVSLPLTIKNWRVSSKDQHLNATANSQVMRSLTDTLRARNLLKN